MSKKDDDVKVNVIELFGWGLGLKVAWAIFWGDKRQRLRQKVYCTRGYHHTMKNTWERHTLGKKSVKIQFLKCRDCDVEMHPSDGAKRKHDKLKQEDAKMMRKAIELMMKDKLGADTKKGGKNGKRKQ